MELTERAAQERLDNPKNLANRFSVKTLPLKKPRDPKALPARFLSDNEVVKIGTESRTFSSVAETAKENKVSVGTVTGIKRGKLGSRYSQNRIERELSKVRDIALEKLMLSLDLITEEKLDSIKAVDLSSIAANMSKVIDKTLPKDKDESGPKIELIIYSPDIKDESSYKTIDV